MTGLDSILKGFARAIDDVRLANPEVPVAGLLMTIDGRAAVLESEQRLADHLRGVIESAERRARRA